MTEATYPQCRIVPARLLNPSTVERLLNGIFATGKIRRMVLNGPNLPAEVPYGPAKGLPNPHEGRKTIKVADEDVQLQVQVGVVILELMDEAAIEDLKEVCDRVFTDFSYSIQKGRYMKSQMTLTDYAKYGPGMEKDLLGMADPRSKGCPIIIQGVK
ncbi:MAG: methyl-coenzyme M reductase operon protein D [Methanomicrobiales archaeon]|nr:methyl-coenzyme M reductase operon protein D [Methanomicrobiales archaeon]